MPTESCDPADNAPAIAPVVLVFPYKFRSKANSYRIKKRKLVKNAAVAAQEKDARSLAIAQLVDHVPWTIPIAMEVHIYAQDKRRFDVDNTLKSLLDALNGVVWKDDSLVIEMHVFKHLGQPPARTIVKVWPA